MALRFDAAADSYSAVTGLPGTTFTFTAWLRIAVDRDDYSEVISFGTTYMSVATDQDGTTVGMWDSGSYNGAPLGGTAFTVGTWYAVAGTVNGANVSWYRRAASASSLTVTSAANYTSGAPTIMRIGDYYDGSFFWNGNVANFKLWSAALTQAEIEHEHAQYVPKRTANMLRWHPFVVADGTDYSGNGNALTAGTAVREDGPPIPWVVSRPIIVHSIASTNVDVDPETATATGTAYDPTVTIETLANVATASATAAAGDVSVTTSESATVQTATAVGIASDVTTTSSGLVEPVTAIATGEAYDVTATTNVVTAPTSASATGAAGDATVSSGISADNAVALGVAHDVTITVSTTVSVSTATANAEAYDVVVLTGNDAVAQAEPALASSVAYDVVVVVVADLLVSVGAASAIGTAYDVGVSGGLPTRRVRVSGREPEHFVSGLREPKSSVTGWREPRRQVNGREEIT